MSAGRGRSPRAGCARTCGSSRTACPTSGCRTTGRSWSRNSSRSTSRNCSSSTPRRSASLAEDESSSKALGAAIKSLLGLDIVERLITDSTVLQTRLAKRPARRSTRRRSSRSSNSLRAAPDAASTALSTERAALENKRLRAETELKEAEEAFAAGGGKHWEARQERSRRLGEVASLEEALRGQLVSLAAGDLPLALVPDLLSRVEEQDERERQAVGAEVIQRLLVERDSQLLEVMRDARGSAALLRRVSEHLEADRLSRQPHGCPSPRRLELSEGHAVLLRHLRGTDGWRHLRGEAEQLLRAGSRR